MVRHAIGISVALALCANPLIQAQGSKTGVAVWDPTLTTLNVNIPQFGKLYTYHVAGGIAAPLRYQAGVIIEGARRNVLHVITNDGRTYAYDADRPTGSPLWGTTVAPPTDSHAAPAMAMVSWKSPVGRLTYSWPAGDVLQATLDNAATGGSRAYARGLMLSRADDQIALTVSANNSMTGTGIVWAATATSDPAEATSCVSLHAYDAETLSELWASEQSGVRDCTAMPASVAAPLVANGRVYLTTGEGTIAVYGLLPQPATPSGITSPLEVATSSSAGAIGINFVGSSPTPMAAAETAGVVAQSNWNNALGASRTTALALVDEAGALSSATVTWSAFGSWMTPITDAAGNARLMKGYLDTSSTSSSTVAVSSLPQASYDVYVYADGDNRTYDRSAAYTISVPGAADTTVTLTDPASTNFGTAFTQAVDSPGNYLRFTITGTAFTVTATPTAPSSGTRRAPINGIQIVPTSVAPPPAPASIGVKFLGSTTVGMAATEIAGVVPKAHWNNAAGAVRSTPLSLRDDEGAATTATITWAANGPWMTPITDQPGNARLMKGYLDTSSTSVTTIRVDGLASASYDVYVYADGDNRSYSRTAAYRISGSGITTSTIDLTDVANTNFSGTFRDAAGGDGNYVRFTITATGFTLTATPLTATGSTLRAPVNAIQILPAGATPPPAVVLDPPMTISGLGAAQGVEVRDGRAYLYGDATTGVIREYDVIDAKALSFTGRQISLTTGGQDVIEHPTGLTVGPDLTTFLGNTVSEQGTIYMLDWPRALANGTLDGAIQRTITDDLGVNGSRPEYVRLDSRWLVATADYGALGNEVRLYDPERLKTAARTSDPGVLVARFPCGPYVQNLHWLDAAGLLVLVQNRQSGDGWRLTVLDLAQSVAAGHEVVTQQIDPSAPGELEGFHMVAPGRGLFVRSESSSNVYFGNVRLY